MTDTLTKATAQANSDMPLISCVIIFLNGERYLAEAIESIRAQTHTNWELILVDDGSTDGATGIAKDYAARYPDQIRYTEHPNHENRGMSASRNAGIALARGEYVALLDADDIWLPHRLARHLQALAPHPEVALSISPSLRWLSWNRAGVPWYRPWLAMDLRMDIRLATDTIMQPPDLASRTLEDHGSSLPGICSLLIRRSAIEAVGGFENSFRRLYEDQVFLFKLFLRYPVIAVDEVLDFYRQHPESACAVADAREGGDFAARPVFLKWLRDHLDEHGFDNPRLRAALDAEEKRFNAPVEWAKSNWANSIASRWNNETRMMVIWAVRPRNYQRLRRMFGLPELHVIYEGPTSLAEAMRGKSRSAA